jgi:hypothetical protein
MLLALLITMKELIADQVSVFSENSSAKIGQGVIIPDAIAPPTRIAPKRANKTT